MTGQVSVDVGIPVANPLTHLEHAFYKLRPSQHHTNLSLAQMCLERWLSNASLQDLQNLYNHMFPGCIYSIDSDPVQQFKRQKNELYRSEIQSRYEDLKEALDKWHYSSDIIGVKLQRNKKIFYISFYRCRNDILMDFSRRTCDLEYHKPDKVSPLHQHNCVLVPHSAVMSVFTVRCAGCNTEELNWDDESNVTDQRIASFKRSDLKCRCEFIKFLAKMKPYLHSIILREELTCPSLGEEILGLGFRKGDYIPVFLQACPNFTSKFELNQTQMEYRDRIHQLDSKQHSTAEGLEEERQLLLMQSKMSHCVYGVEYFPGNWIFPGWFVITRPI